MALTRWSPVGDITRWSPWTELSRMREEMDRLFDRFFEPIEGREYRPVSWSPSVDVFEQNGNLVVEAELPGIRKEDLEVSLDDGTLTIRGEVKREDERKEEGFYRHERHYGRFMRSIPLPVSVKTDEVKAHFENGVLQVTLPKAEEELRGKKIEIK